MTIKVDENTYIVINNFYAAIIIDGLEFGLGSPV